MKTATNTRIKALEQEFGATLPEILIYVYEQERSLSGVAIRLGVSQSTISNWMVRYGLRVQTSIGQYYPTIEGLKYLVEFPEGQEGNHD